MTETAVAERGGFTTLPQAVRPLLFLDVDGVLNKLGAGPRALPEGGSGSVLRPCEEAREKVERLAEVFEIVWASQWRERAPLVWGKELGIGAGWPHLSYGKSKLPAIRRYANGRAWAWVDDLAEPCDDGVIVVPDPAEGVSWEMVEALCSHYFSRSEVPA